MNTVFKKLQLVEFILPGISGGNTATKLQFTDQPYLRGKQITSLEVFNASDIPTSPQQNALITAAQMAQTYLTLYTNDPDNKQNEGEFIQYIPLICFHRTQNSTPSAFMRELFMLDQNVIIWEKSYVTFVTGLNNTTNLSLLFSVGFQG